MSNNPSITPPQKPGLSPERFKALSDLFIVSLVVFCLGVAHEQLNPILSWDRSAIEQGQWWRIVTGNIVHLNVNHMLMNLSIYVLAALLFKKYCGWRQWYGSFLFIATGVGLALYVFDASLQNYVGLSGVLYGMIAQQLLLQSRQQPWLYLFIYAVLVYKVVAQQGADYDASEMKAFIGGNVIASAHLYGLILGNVAAASLFVFKLFKTQQQEAL
ncbi:rhombosortase [Agaribacterium haliotis]|uniref:rhombosortase n=1 Tax=Agaribacterium haliotis TaxID=2013869 RepID=UPI000BB570DF|nr:rhombosortase [Agaribacterium haliotis]